MPTEGALNVAKHIADHYGDGKNAVVLAELIDLHTMDKGRTVLVSPMPDGDIKVDYRQSGKVVDKKFYSQQDFAKMGRAAFFMGTFVTP